MLKDLDKAPFPYFGGKRLAAPAVWAALGDVEHYCEPFMGSLAVLLLRPHQANRTYHSETVNDADGLLCNAWRSIQLSPDATAEAASWPVSEADMHARHLALVRWRANTPLERLMGDPAWHDPIMAGYWIWGCCCWIGSGWCAGTGPWTVDENGIFYMQGRVATSANAREPGVDRKRPHIGNDGQGVNRPQAREPGVERKLPHISDNGKGVNRPQAREPGVEHEREFHPMTMPEVRRWFAFLSARLRHVRILHGDWRRLCTHGATHMLSARGEGHYAGIFLDPPYSGDVRCKGLYAIDSHDVAKQVLAWCAQSGSDPNLRIVLAGFKSEGHDILVSEYGWREVEWYKKGWLRGGMANTGKSGGQQKLERLWLSPNCLADEKPNTLFRDAK